MLLYRDSAHAIFTAIATSPSLECSTVGQAAVCERQSVPFELYFLANRFLHIVVSK
jgi:hypothetical protein